jgi:CRP/FNR family transcriptional regulator, cyclic AMP receptor protein
VARGIPSAVIRHFQAVPLFRSVSKSGIRGLVSAATEIDVKAGTMVVEQGGFDRDLFVIIGGTADVIKNGKRITTLGPGDFFGELALFLRLPRTATVTARTDMTLMVLAAREMDVILEREHAVAKQVLASLADRVAKTEKQALTH